MDRKKTFGFSGRTSLIAQSNQKTPTRHRFSVARTPDTSNKDGRFSLGNGVLGTGARRMSVFKQPANPTRVDTSDKHKQQEYIKKIIEFVTQIEGEEGINPSQVTRPTMKDFIYLVEVIYECISPNYALGDKKVLEEVPRLFNFLSYPFPIKPSYLQPIGASHNWHYLLHALAWLIDLVNAIKSLEEVVGPQILLSGDNSNGNIGAVRYSWFQTKFKESCANKGAVFSDQDQLELGQWFETQEDIAGQLRAAEDALESIRKENDEIERDTGTENKLVEDLNKVDDDIRKASSYIEALTASYACLSEEREGLVVAVDEVKGEMDELKKKHQNAKDAMLEQERGTGLQGECARQMMSEYESNRVLLRQLQSDIESVCKERWSLHPVENQAFAQLSSRFSELVSMVLMHRQEFSDDIEEDINPKDIKEMQALVSGKVKNLLLRTGHDIEIAKERMEKCIDSLRQKIRSIETQISVETEKMTDCKRTLKRKEINRERCREDQKKERQHIISKNDNYENEKESIENYLRDANKFDQKIEEAEREVEKLEEEIRLRKLTFEDTLITMAQKVTSILDAEKTVSDAADAKMSELERTLQYHLHGIMPTLF